MAAESEAETHEESGAAGATKPGEKTPATKKKEQKKQTIIAVAAVLGVVIAFISFKKSGSGGGTSSALPAGGSIGAYTPSGSVVGSGSDSSAMQGLSSLLSNQSQMLGQIESAIVGLTPAQSTADTPTVTPPALQLGQFAANDSYVRDATPGSGAIYQVQPGSNGAAPTYYHLTPQDYAALGMPTYTNYSNK